MRLYLNWVFGAKQLEITPRRTGGPTTHRPVGAREEKESVEASVRDRRFPKLPIMAKNGGRPAMEGHVLGSSLSDSGVSRFRWGTNNRGGR